MGGASRGKNSLEAFNTLRLSQDQRLQGEDSLTCLLLSCGQVLADSTGTRIPVPLLYHPTISHQACQPSEMSQTLSVPDYFESKLSSLKESVPKDR